MAKPKTLEFANFVLTFGPHRVMADFLDEIVLPTFTDSNLVRTYGETTFFFTDVAVINLGTKKNPEPGIVGTFIKDTVLRSSQVWNKSSGRIEPSNRKIPNAPSVTFVLVLATHKLLYLHETPQAPGIDAFRGTMLRFLHRKWLEFVEKQYATRRASESDEKKKKVTKKSLKEEYPPPELSIIPLGSEAAIGEELKRFKLLTEVRVTMTRVNSESDYDQFFALMREEHNAVEANETVLYEKVDKEETLNKEKVAKQLAAIGVQGNANVRLDGTSVRDVPIVVSNDEIRLRIPMTNLPAEPEEKARVLFNELTKSIDDGTVLVGKLDEAQAKAIRDRFRF